VESVGAALLLPQGVVAGAHIEDERVFRLGQIRHGKKIGGLEISYDHLVARRDQLLRLLDRITVGGQQRLE
jgi:hypothetical protein